VDEHAGTKLLLNGWNMWIFSLLWVYYSYSTTQSRSQNEVTVGAVILGGVNVFFIKFNPLMQPCNSLRKWLNDSNNRLLFLNQIILFINQSGHMRT
jgi:hypothetical protein